MILNTMMMNMILTLKNYINTICSIYINLFMMTILLDKIKIRRDIYCFEKKSLFYQLKQQKKDAKTIDVFKYNFFCENTRPKQI